MNPKTENLKEKIRELNKMKQLAIEDIETKPPTPLDRKIIEKYEEIWQEVLKICKEENIRNAKKFDEKYRIFQWGLEDFIESYSNLIDYCGQMDEIYLEPEIKMLTETLEQFHIDKDTKQEFELIIIRDTYMIGNKKEAEKQINQWIKANPEVGEGYEVKCDWELEKSKPDMEKIANILDEAENNGTFVPNEDIYEEVIEYYEKIGNDELAEYYESLLDLKEERYYDEEDMEEYDDFLEEEREKVIEDIKEMSKDKVKKNKTFEEYILDTNAEEQMRFLFPQIIMNTEEKTKLNQEDMKKYILENYDTILKENMKYMPKYVMECIRKFPANGFIEINLDNSNMQELMDIHRYFLLKLSGMAFMECKNNKLVISIPYIKKMKEYIKDEHIMEKNKDINEKMDIISGICQVYGAIKTRKIYHILEKFYEGVTKEQLAKYLLMFCSFFGIANIKIETSTGSLQFIYNNLIDEESAKKIIKENKKIKDYTKEEYIKYSTLEYLKNTKGYKKLEKEFNSNMFFGEDLFEMLGEMLIPYTLERRLDGKKADEILDILIQQIEQMNKMGLSTMNIETVKKGFKELDSELPKW